jgi:glycosyltransferase involved in cell wall biosynthesis
MKPQISNRPILLIATSSAPFGHSELWFQSEVEELSKTHRVIMLASLPRGEKQPWAGEILTTNGRPPTAIFGVLRLILMSRETRKILLSTIKSGDMRSALKAVVAGLVGLQWVCELKRRNIRPWHIHSTIVGAPATLAAIVALHLDISASATAHRGDIVHRTSPYILRSMVLIRAISSRAQDMLRHDGIESTVLRFGGVTEVSATPVCQSSPELRCVSIGNLIKVKGHIRAIEMIDHARKLGLDVTLDIIGQGELDGELSSEISRLNLSNSVRLAGPKPHEELLGMLGSGEWNVLIHPSIEDQRLHEGIPVSVLEAASLGLAIIASRSGSTTDVIENMVSGILISATSYDDAVNEGVLALQQLSSSPELQTQLGMGALDIARQFRASVTVATLLTALDAVVEIPEASA